VKREVQCNCNNVSLAHVGTTRDKSIHLLGVVAVGLGEIGESGCVNLFFRPLHDLARIRLGIHIRSLGKRKKGRLPEISCF